MNKSLLISLSTLGMMLLLTSSVLQAQNVGIGTNNPHPKALVHLEDSTRGFLPTRLTTAQRDTLTNRPEGLVIYNVTTHCLEFWNGSNWISTCAGTVPCNKPPKPIPTPNDTVYWCLGEDGQLCVNNISGFTYTWTGPNGFYDTGACVTVPNVNSSSFGTYTVYAYNGTANCSSEDTVVVALQKTTPYFSCTSSNTWNPLPTPPVTVSLRNNHIIVSHLGYVYLGFGNTTSSCVNNWWRWNPTCNTWKQLANPPVNFGGLPFTFTIGNYIYVGGGGSACGGPINSFYRYDPANNTWSPMASFPINVFGAVGTSDGTYGYVACGYNGATYLNTLYRYDPSADSWTLLTSLPGPTRHIPDLAYYQGKLYIGGGYGSTCFQDFYSYNIASNTWATLANHPNKHWDGYAVAYNGRIYVTGEHILAGYSCFTCTDQFYYYDIAIDTWQPLAIFPGGPRNNLEFVEVNGVFYGGFGYNCYSLIGDWWAYCP